MLARGLPYRRAVLEGRHPGLVALGLFAFAFPMGIAVWRLVVTAHDYEDGHLSLWRARAGMYRGLGWLAWATMAEAVFVHPVAVPIALGVVGIVFFQLGRWQ